MNEVAKVASTISQGIRGPEEKESTIVTVNKSVG